MDFGSVISYSLFEQHRLTEKRLGLAEGTLTWMGPFAPESDALWQQMLRDEISEREYWGQRARETGKLLGNDWTMLEFITAVREVNDLVVRPEIAELVADCRAAGRPVAILSNELELFYGTDVKEKLSILDEMAFIVDATYTKILKPDPRAYHLAIDGFGLEARDIVFVDDQKRNILGAERVGIQAVHFDITSVNSSIARIRELLALGKM